MRRKVLWIEIKHLSLPQNLRVENLEQAPINDKSPRRAYHKNCWRVIFLYMENQKSLTVSEQVASLTNMLYLCNAVRPDNHVKANLKNLFAKFPKVKPVSWGFMDGWDKEPIWK